LKVIFFYKPPISIELTPQDNEWDNHVKAQCKLCNLLNKILTGDYKVRHYEDMTLFWNTQSRCRAPNF
jgi:hypothetical protein